MSNGDALTSRVEELEQRLAVYDDRQAICDVLYRYARAADRCDLELFKSCYWPDGTDVHWFYNGNAHAFADYVVPLLAQIANSQHSITNPMIELDNERAIVESQYYVMHHIPLREGKSEWFVDQQMEGRYIDVFERREGVWRILHRQLVVESGREFVGTPPIPMPAGHPGLGQRAPHDVLFRSANLLDAPIVAIDGSDLWGQARARHNHVSRS